jgi:hypothetical protein
MEAQIIGFPYPKQKQEISAVDIDRMVEQELQLSLTRHPAGKAMTSGKESPEVTLAINVKPEFLFPSKMMPEGVQFANGEEINHHRSTLDAELAKISDVLGEFQTRRIAKLIQSLSMSIADNAYAEGLSNGFLYLDEQENR